MFSLVETLLKLARQLYPTGLAMRMPVNGYKEGLHRALGISEEAALNSVMSVMYSILPDNVNFTADDATDWERRLGMISNSAVPLADRKLAIKRKMNHPGLIKARQHYLYLQGQLQQAGFNVFVHENIPELAGIEYLTTYMSLIEFIQLNDLQLGDFQLNDFVWKNKVVNHITAAQDFYFMTGANRRSCFFIGGETFGTTADVLSEREAEFRQLILKVKPAQTCAFLFINYT